MLSNGQTFTAAGALITAPASANQTTTGGSMLTAQSFARIAPIVPSDTVSQSFPGKALLVLGAGNIVLLNTFGDLVTLTGVLAGALLPIEVKRVNLTLTTATNMFALA